MSPTPTQRADRWVRRALWNRGVQPEIAAFILANRRARAWQLVELHAAWRDVRRSVRRLTSKVRTRSATW